MVSPWGFGVVNMVAEIDGRATSWRRTVVTLMTMGLNGLNNRSWWGAKWEKLSVLRFTLVIASKRSVAKASIDPGRTSLLEFEDLKIMSTAKNEYTMDDSPDWLFKNLDCSRACYFYCLHLASRNRIDATRSSRWAAWVWVDRDFQKITTKKRKVNERVPNFLVQKMTSSRTSE
jgi:hypothetical protein